MHEAPFVGVYIPDLQDIFLLDLDFHLKTIPSFQIAWLHFMEMGLMRAVKLNSKFTVRLAFLPLLCVGI